MNLLQSISKFKKEIKRANGLMNVAIKNKDEVKVDAAFALADDNYWEALRLLREAPDRDSWDSFALLDVFEVGHELDQSWYEILTRFYNFYIE